MRFLSFIFIGFVLVCCKQHKAEPACAKGLMNRAYYEHGADTSIPQMKGLRDEFMILVDTTLFARNFISFREEYARSLSTDTFEASSYLEETGYAKPTHKQIQTILDRNKRDADSIHRINNSGQHLVWIINNSKDTVTLQMQDWLYICILEAIDINDNWKPIEYWRFSKCGNSYYNKSMLPKTANSFTMEIPKNGNYKTNLRFKLLGLDKFYYSNAFNGNIDYCSFTEDSLNFERGKPHYKLEKRISLILPRELKLKAVQRMIH